MPDEEKLLKKERTTGKMLAIVSKIRYNVFDNFGEILGITGCSLIRRRCVPRLVFSKFFEEEKNYAYHYCR